MSLSWIQRKKRLSLLLKCHEDEDAAGLALDRLLHGQNVIGRTSRTTEIDVLRFQDKDLELVGTLDRGQFGVIDVVTCQLDGRVYVRKSVEKKFALRTRDQCFPLFERDILLRARKTDSEWAPHLLCAFQTVTHLNLVMQYAQGGTLWDVLESSPNDGKVLEEDLRWWTPQVVSAVHWCHSQGFAHRQVHFLTICKPRVPLNIPKKGYKAAQLRSHRRCPRPAYRFWLSGSFTASRPRRCPKATKAVLLRPMWNL